MNTKELALMKKAVVFYGNDIALKPICDTIGLVYRKQLSVVKSDTKLGQLCSKQYTVGADNKQREMFCLPKKGILIWLFRIQAFKIKEKEVRENLEKMQDLIYEYLNSKEKQADSYERYILRIRNIETRETELKNTIASCGRELKALYKEKAVLLASDPNQMELPFEEPKQALEFKPL